MTYLVQAATLPAAVKNIDEVMGGTMIDYIISSVSETMFMDVFVHGSNADNNHNEVDDRPEFEAVEDNKEA